MSQDNTVHTVNFTILIFPTKIDKISLFPPNPNNYNTCMKDRQKLYILDPDVKLRCQVKRIQNQTCPSNFGNKNRNVKH